MLTLFATETTFSSSAASENMLMSREFTQIVSLNNGDLGNVLANSQSGEYISSFIPSIAGRAGVTMEICDTNWCSSLTEAGLVPYCGTCNQVIQALTSSGVDSG